jgi:hypothetical protein
MQQVAGQAGGMSDMARARMARALTFRTAPTLDIAAMDAELKVLMDQAHG